MKKIVFLTAILIGFLGSAQNSTITKFSLKGRVFEIIGSGNGLTGAQIVDSVNTALGGTDWQTGGVDQTLSLGGTGNKDLTISGTGGNTVPLPVLANANQLITQDRTITIDGVGTKFGISPSTLANSFFSYEVFANSQDNLLQLGNPSQGLSFSVNNGWTFSSPFTFFSSTSDPVAVEGRAYYNTTTNKPLYFNGTQWVEFNSGSGDMTKSVYDADDDGKVDNAETLNGASASPFDGPGTLVMRNSVGQFETVDNAYGPGWNNDLTVPTKKAIYEKIESLSASTYPSTAPKELMTYHSTKKILADSVFDAASLHNGRLLFLTANDTVEASDAVTSARYGEWITIIAKDIDSAYIRPIGNDTIKVMDDGTKVKAGQGLVFTNSRGITMMKEDANNWWLSGSVTVHTEVTPQFYPYNDPLAIGTQESNNITGFTDANFSFTLMDSGGTPTPQNGDFAILCEKTGNGGSFENFSFPIGTTVPGNTYRIEIYAYNISGTVWDVQLSTGNGWVTSEISTVPTPSGWHLITVEGESNAVDSKVRINNSLAVGQQLAIDNITVTDLGVIP